MKSLVNTRGPVDAGAQTLDDHLGIYICIYKTSIVISYVFVYVNEYKRVYIYVFTTNAAVFDPKLNWYEIKMANTILWHCGNIDTSLQIKV